jgi:putative mRNA 3-end processing factor
MTLKANFLGGAREVGKLGLVLDFDERKFLFDYGMAPDKPPQYPLEAPPVDIIALTHAHLDHSGMLPWVASRYEASILTTRPSAEVATLMHHDSLKIANIEGYPAPYDKSAIKHTEKVWDYVQYAESREAAGMEMKFHSAGHIPGSTMYELRGSRKVVFTGDLFMTNTRLLWGAEPVKCDLLFLESTYSGREHNPREDEEKRFLDAVDDTIKRGGVAIVPSFAVGRAQETAMVLQGRGHRVWLDGMGKTVVKTFLKYPEFLRNKKDLQKAMNEVKIINSQHQRKQALKGDVIITTSGMLDGGPVLFYLSNLYHDSKSAVLMTGYQVQGTNGRRLLETGTVEIQGADLKVACRVDRFDFSAHAGHKDLVRFAKASGAKDVVLYHGDSPEPLMEDIGKFTNVHAPAIGEDLIFRD